MKNYQKLFIIVLLILTVAFVSCSEKNETTKPSPDPTWKPIQLVGTWTNAVNSDTFTVVDNGSDGRINIGEYYVLIEAEEWATKNNERVDTFTAGGNPYDSSGNPIMSILYSFLFDSSRCIFRKDKGITSEKMTYYKQ